MARSAPAHLSLASSRDAWTWALVGAVAGALWAALQFAPALWLQRAVLAASDGRIVLRESQGTVWHGSAQLGVAGGSGSHDAARLPGRVQWDLHIGLGRVQITLQATCCTQQAQLLELTPGLRNWRLDIAAGESTLPAAVLSGLGTPWNTVQLQGHMVLKTPGMSLISSADRLQLEGSATLDLLGLSSSLSTLRPLGSYHLLLQGGPQPTLDLRTVEGRLQLQGAGRWTAGHLRFVGDAKADTAYEAALSNLLNIMGRRDGARSVITLG